MRKFFFIGILVLGVVAGVAYFIWKIVSALYEDWSLGKDVHRIKVESAQRRAQRQQEEAARLDNGCAHAFGHALGGFPPNACRKCGLERERPAGPCDHVWRRSNEPVPCSYCEKCGRKYVSPTIRDL